MKINKGSFRSKIFILLVGIYCLMRIYRNSFNYYVTQQGGLWNIISLLFIVYSLIILFSKKRLLNHFNMAIVYIIAYSLLAIVNTLINFDNINISFVYNTIMIVFFPAVILIFYYISNDLYLKSTRFIVLLVFYAISIFALISTFFYKIGILDFVMISNSYYSLCFLPIVFQLYGSKSKVSLICWIFCMVTLIISTKRAGILACILFLFCVFIIDTYMSHDYKKTLRNLFVMIIILCFGFLIYSMLDNALDLNIVERFLNMFNDGGSGRLGMYKQMIDAIMKSSPFELFFGHGLHTSVEVLIVHEDVHNDFLQILYEFGIFPFICFCLFYFELVKIFLKMLLQRYERTGVFLGGVTICGCLSMLSVYCISFTYIICGAAFLGLSIADWNNYRGLY